ncbi:MAG: hypothetical protein [Circular genetic element sp.]|nr:MAG: hypothetical protein [Circular genetic element sp.]
MAILSVKQERDLLIGLGLLDFVTRGRVNAAAFDLTLATLKRVLPAAGRVGLSVGGSAARAAVPLVTNPYLAGAALGYGALQTETGQQLLQSAEESGASARRDLDMALFNLQARAEEKVKRTKSKFNTAVSRGMSAAKASTSYGAKGVINAPKKAFAAVTKVASKINKAKKAGTKLPKRPTGINAKKIYSAILGVLK